MLYTHSSSYYATHLLNNTPFYLSSLCCCSHPACSLLSFFCHCFLRASAELSRSISYHIQWPFRRLISRTRGTVVDTSFMKQQYLFTAYGSLSLFLFILPLLFFSSKPCTCVRIFLSLRYTFLQAFCFIISPFLLVVYKHCDFMPICFLVFLCIPIAVVVHLLSLLQSSVYQNHTLICICLAFLFITFFLPMVVLSLCTHLRAC